MNRKDRRRAAADQRKAGSATAGRISRPMSAATDLLAAAHKLHGERQFLEAIELCQRVLAHNERDAEALLILGSASINLKQHTAARSYIDRAITCRPEDPRGWLLLTSYFLANGDAQAASDACEKALQIAPALPDAHAAMGNILASERRFELAERSFRRALELRSGTADTEANLGSALFYQGKLEEAVAAQRRALAHNPTHVYALKNLAASLRALGKFQEALAAYRHAIAIEPLFAEAHRDEGLLLLLLGQFKEGWSKYEWRLGASTIGTQPIPGPRWHGESHAGRTILLQAEQGIGDTIQFLRYVPMVAESCGSVVLRLPASLVGLCGDAIAAAARVVTMDEPMPQYDSHTSLMSLPNTFATGIDNIPGPVRYLCPPERCAEHWQREFGAIDGIRVGLAWAGNPMHENDHNRSISFSYLLPLLAIEAVQFYCLQVGPRSTDAALANGRATDLSASLTDFSATAGAIDALDLVITVDTAVAHLAGAMGKTVWLLLPHIPDWRWLLGRDDSPWYPTMRLFRQESRGDWPGVIARVTGELGRLASHNGEHDAIKQNRIVLSSH
jgi:tetratricopeptide (TPR) repeat protein